jgi:hypothetical protein
MARRKLQPTEEADRWLDKHPNPPFDDHMIVSWCIRPLIDGSPVPPRAIWEKYRSQVWECCAAYDASDCQPMPDGTWRPRIEVLGPLIPAAALEYDGGRRVR